MNSSEERFVRHQIRKILTEQWGDGLGGLEFGEMDLGIGEQQFFDTFIGPFVDVIKVGNVAVQDVASAALRTIQAHLTFNLEKKKALQQQFRADRKEYASKMEKAMKSTFDTFNSDDAKLLMFMMNPGAYMGAAMVSSIAGSGITDPITDVVGDALGGFGEALGIGTLARTGSDMKAKEKESEKGPLRGLMNDLKVLFFGEGLDEIDEIELILREEQEEKSEKKKEKTSEKEVQAEMERQLEETGILDEFENWQNEIIKAKKDEIAYLKEQIGAQVKALNELQRAQTLEELKGPVSALAALGVDLSKEVSTLEKELTAQGKTLQTGGEEAQKIIDSLAETPEGKNLGPDADSASYLPVLQQSMIAGVFGGIASEAKQAFGGELVGFVGELSEDELKKMAAASKSGAEYVALIGGFEQWITGLE